MFGSRHLRGARFSRWLAASLLPWLLAAARLARAEPPVPLSEDERAWIAAHPRIRLVADPAWPPCSFFVAARGRFDGSDIEILRRAAARLGLAVDDVPCADWSDAERRLAAGEADVTCAVTSTPERDAQFLFTRPYFSFPVAIIARQDAPFLISLQLSKSHLRAAAPRGFVTLDFLRRRLPSAAVLETRTSREALDAVARGEADLTVENLAVASQYIRAHRLANLKISGFLEERFDFALATRRDLPLLHSALEKALDSIPVTERSEIFGRWAGEDYSPGLGWRRVLAWSAAGVALLALVGGAGVWHTRRLGRELAERRRVERELRAVSEEKSRFMGMAAHDLKNPLTAILCGSELLLGRRKRYAFDDEAAATLGQIQEGAHRMLRLIRNLLDADAIERGATHLHPVALDLSAAVSAALARFRLGAERKDVALRAVLPETPVRVLADPDALSQVLDNLISNAVKFSAPAGEVRVAVALPEPAGDGAAARTVQLEVADGGPGVPAADQPRLFTPHARLSSRPTGGESSTGLGLSIVKRLVEAMGGTVGYCGGENGGACFRVSLPAAGGTPLAQ